jgi:HK97 family phage major capsid protein
VSSTLEKENRDLSVGERDILVPLEALCVRALIPDNFTSAGALIGSELSQNIAKALRPYSVCYRAGAQSLMNLKGNLQLTRELSPVNVTWMHPQDTATSSDDTFGQISFSPKRVAGLATLSKEVQLISQYDVSAFVQDSIATGLGVALDKAGIQGAGEFGEPLGIFNTNGVGTVTFGGAATYAKAVNFESQITTALGTDENISFVATPVVRERWKNIQRFASGAKALWEDDETIAGKRAFVTTSCPANSICAGDFTKMFFGWFGEGAPIQITVDKFSRKKEGLLELYLQSYCDVAIARPQLFVVNTDSAAV